MTPPTTGKHHWRSLQKAPLIDIRDLRTEYALDVLPSPRENIDNPWVRYLVLTLWDGRCFWCGAALFQIEGEMKSDPDGPVLLPPVFELDHFLPRNFGGADAVLNFVPACKMCNGSRLDNPYASSIKVSRWREARQLLIQYPELLQLQPSSDIPIPPGGHPHATGHAFFTLHMRRCMRHDLHVVGSWELNKCIQEGVKAQRINGHRWPGQSEIALAFGSRSEEIFRAVKDSTRFASKPLDESEVGAAMLNLARRIGDPEKTLSYLSNIAVDEIATNHINPAANMMPTALAHVSDKRSFEFIKKANISDVADLQRDLKEDLGFQWKGLATLWVERGWPSHLLYDYEDVFKNAATCRRTPFIKDLRRFGSHEKADLDKYLAEQWRILRNRPIAGG